MLFFNFSGVYMFNDVQCCCILMILTKQTALAENCSGLANGDCIMLFVI